MDQAESSTPGRPLTYSGKHNKSKVFIITLFVDSISKKVFTEFQISIGAKEKLAAKHSMEREIKIVTFPLKILEVTMVYLKLQYLKQTLKTTTNLSHTVELVLTSK